MQPAVFTKTLATASATNIALVQALGAAGNLTLNGAAVTAGVATLDTARRVGLTSSGNDSGLIFTVKGGDYSGNAISEAVTGANAGVASTKQDFLTITSIASSGAVAGTVSVGTTSTGSTPWWVPNYNIDPFEVAVGVEILSGSATASVEVTDDSPLAPLYIYRSGWSQAPPVPIATAWPGLSGLAANAMGDINRTCAGIRLTITAGTGNVQMTLRQAGIISG